MATAAALLLLGGLASTATASGTSLLLAQSTAFSVLGASCGGIQEQAFGIGFDPVSGHPDGAVYLQTRCGGSGRGGGYHTTTYSAWTSATWDFSGAVVSYVRLASAPAGLDPALSTFDAHGDQLYNLLGRAYLSVPVPAAPTAVSALQTASEFQVSWTPDPARAAVITSSTITATPVNSTALAVTVTVIGSGTTGRVGPLQPQTTYTITVLSTTAGGPGAASAPISATTGVASMPPSAPAHVAGHWTAPGQPGDTLLATWSVPASPGDSPIDQYEATVRVTEGDAAAPGPFTQTVSGPLLAAGFAASDSYDWYIQVRAHNAAGWGAWSAPITLSSSN